MRLGWLRRLLDHDEASAIVELASSLSVLCLLLFTFMEICLATYSYDLISELACEGTRYAMVRGASCPTSSNPTCETTASKVNSYVSGVGLPNLAGGKISVDTTYPDGSEAVGNRVEVGVSYAFPISMPLVEKKTFTMSTSSTAYIIQ